MARGFSPKTGSRSPISPKTREFIDYNEGVAQAQKLAAAGKVLIVAPDDTCGVTTLTRDSLAIAELYVKGYRDGPKIESFLEKN